jgi:HSP20 family protein
MLTLWNPFDDLLREEEFWRRTPGPRAAHTPAVDVIEEKGAFLLKAEVPGVAADQVDVSLDGNVLTLKGDQRHEHEDTREGYRRIERRYGSFQRSFTLPDSVDVAAVEATLSDGVLTVRVPKKPALQPRKIAVQAGGLVNKAKKIFGKDQPAEQRTA